MKKLLLTLLLCLSLPLATSAQVSSGTARRINPRATAPTTCNPNTGEHYFNTTDKKLYRCTAANTWTASGDTTLSDSASLRSALSDETGTGAAVFANSPALVTPNLGTPSALTLTNATGLPVSTGLSGLGSGVASLLATPSSANLASAVTDETGTGALVLANSPALTTPDIGAATGASLSVTGQLTSTVATGTAPLAVTSTTPVANLNARPLVYLSSGTQHANSKIVIVGGVGGAARTVRLAAGTASVTFSGSAAWTSSGSYVCIPGLRSALNPVRVTNDSASQITVTGTGTDIINLICVGN